MKTIKNIIEYINESKIVNLFKNLFSKLKTTYCLFTFITKKISTFVTILAN